MACQSDITLVVQIFLQVKSAYKFHKITSKANLQGSWKEIRGFVLYGFILQQKVIVTTDFVQLGLINIHEVCHCYYWNANLR